MSPIISPKELALAIGVSESSLKRWADDGLIRVSRTAGGHRRITIGEAIRFIRSTRTPLLRPEMLGLSQLMVKGDLALLPESPAERLLQYLKEGQSPEARGWLTSMYLAGQSVADLADGPIRDALHHLGRLWQHGPEGIFIEHRATNICIQAIHQLLMLIPLPGDAPCAVGGAGPGDPYLIPSILAATALAEAGWRPVNLGADTPFDALAKAIHAYRPQLVWFSLSTVRDAATIESGLEKLALDCADRNITLVLGGRAIGDVRTPAAAGVVVGGSIADLIACARHAGSGAPPAPDDAAPQEDART